MRLRKSRHLTLTLLVAAGLGVCAAPGQAQVSTQKKSTSSRTSRSSHVAKSSKKSKARERGQKVPAPERISEIQQALAKNGSFTGTPNGKWDASTIEATRKFQEAQGLNPTGKIDAKTLQHLGLGSRTAGVAAPMPPVNSSSLQKTPSPQAAARRQ
jgi:peptidoglycan hydrolase-like protein with peptidoglycan-binding domain